MDIRLPLRKATSHKGQNGSVGVIGGNEIFHGAPLLAALGAEKSGTDLVYLLLPPAHSTAAKTSGKNFIIRTFFQDHLTPADLESMEEWSEKTDATVIGNGLGKSRETQTAVLKFLINSKKPLVIDGDALFPEILTVSRHASWIITPHEGEFERLFGIPGTADNVNVMAKKHAVTILKKGPTDFIAAPDGSFVMNKTGCPEMTTGGTGDALAGIVAGFVARGLTAFQACETAAYLWGKCGEMLAADLFAFSADDLLKTFPASVRGLFPL